MPYSIGSCIGFKVYKYLSDDHARLPCPRKHGGAYLGRIDVSDNLKFSTEDTPTRRLVDRKQRTVAKPTLQLKHCWENV